MQMTTLDWMRVFAPTVGIVLLLAVCVAALLVRWFRADMEGQ